MPLTDPFVTGADTVFQEYPDWRQELDDDDPDDEQIETPEDVIAVLGFDPVEFATTETEPAQFAEDALSSQDEIAAIGTAAARKILRRSSREISASLKKNAGLSELRREIEQIIARTRINLGRVLTQTTLAADITGAAEALSLANLSVALPSGAVSRLAQGSAALPPSFTLDSLLPAEWPKLRFPVVEDAIDVLRTAPVASGTNFRATADAVQQGAFAITGDLADESIANVRDLIQKQIEGGLDRGQFIAEARAALTDGPGLSDARLDLVFNQNVAAALSDAAERSLKQPLVVDAFPYREYNATDDTRVRPTHFHLEVSGLNGTAVYWHNDPVWRTLRPPWEFGCRCSFIPLTVEMAASRGVKEAQQWLARAKAAAVGTGQPFDNFLVRTAPDHFQRVPWPTLDGERIEPSPAFRRVAQFDEDTGNDRRQELLSRITEAASETDTHPTDEQIEAENYRKGKFSMHGMRFAIENPKGSIRSGKDWEVTMPAHYGYILMTESEADGDHVDCFIGDNPESEIVFVVDQVTQQGGIFDEHKCMIGFTSEANARETYKAAYAAGWKVGPITQMTMDDFRKWLERGDTGHRVSDQTSSQFDEEFERKHPRADDGKFGDKTTTPTKQLEPTQKAKAVRPLAERNAVADYTSDKFQPINAMLREGSKGTPELQGIVTKVDSFLANSEKAPGVTFRRIAIPEGRRAEFEALFRKGEQFADPSFLSTRMEPDVSIRAAFAGSAAADSISIKIRGQNGVDVSTASLNPGEKEVLFPRGTAFNVVDVKRVKGGGLLVLLDETTAQFSEPLTPKQLRRKNRKARRVASRGNRSKPV